jgi:mono/diheme cytochrome c family protein
MRPARRLAILALAAGFGASCAAALRHASPEDAVRVAPQWPGTTVAVLERGRRLYVRRCAGCHTLVLPAAHPPGEWPRLVDSMAKKARLRPDEREDVVRFLVAVASDDARRAGR